MAIHTRDLQALPKAHLHIHLEGAMRPSTLDELCARYGIARPDDTRGVRFDNFGGFVETFWAASDCIRTHDDLARLILEVAEDAAAHGSWWIEPAFDAERYSAHREGSPYRLFQTQEEGWLFALQAAEAAERATGVGIGFMSAVDRILTPERAVSRARVTAELVASKAHMIRSGMASFRGEHAGIVAFGLHGNEEGFPPQPFAEAFSLALEASDLLSTPHAGEIAPFPGGGPASVRDAIDHLGARRILHGVLAIEDSRLVERLAREQICLDVCPSSNLLLNVFPSAEAHPLPQLLDAGVPCDLGSDDPLLFGPSLLDEFVLCREQMGLSDAQLAAMAKTSFVYSGAPQAVKDAGQAAVDAWLDAATATRANHPRQKN
jgi:adenosine deaminase